MKRAVMGEGIVMIYRLVLIAFSAFIILGISSVFYAHYIDVRESETIILTRNIADCLTIKNFNLSFDGDVLDYCGFVDERFFVRVGFFDASGNRVKEISGGDSGAELVNKIFMGKPSSTENIKQFKPGYFKGVYSCYDNELGKLKMVIEAIVEDEK